MEDWKEVLKFDVNDPNKIRQGPMNVRFANLMRRFQKWSEETMEMLAHHKLVPAETKQHMQLGIALGKYFQKHRLHPANLKLEADMKRLKNKLGESSNGN
tara:strand:+ start:257 stop:556 length:300 start_codon:yes stop_codon:yes gene_type:complete